MAAWRYEISLRVLKNISRAMRAANERNIFSTREEKFRIFKRPCNILYLSNCTATFSSRDNPKTIYSVGVPFISSCQGVVKRKKRNGKNL